MCRSYINIFNGKNDPTDKPAGGTPMSKKSDLRFNVPKTVNCYAFKIATTTLSADRLDRNEKAK